MFTRKIGSFISAIVSFLVSCLLSYVCYKLTNNISFVDGSSVVTAIVSMPLLICLYVVLFGFLLSGFVTSFISIFSSSKLVKIVSIVLLVFIIALIGFYIYELNLFFSIKK